VHDIVLIQLGPNIVEGKAAKPGQANLSERAMGNHILSKWFETNLVR